MPARRDLTLAEFQAQLERRREQTRLRMSRWRARHVCASREGVRVTSAPESEPVRVTPPVLPARDTVPPQRTTPLPPKGGAPLPLPGPARTALRAVPKPDRIAAVIDALRAEGMTGTLTPRDRKAIKDIAHDPGDVAALYAAIFTGAYGDDWMHDNLSVALCLEKLPGWRSHQAGHTAPARKNGRPLSGVAAMQAVFAREGVHVGRNGTGR